MEYTAPFQGGVMKAVANHFTPAVTHPGYNREATPANPGHAAITLLLMSTTCGDEGHASYVPPQEIHVGHNNRQDLIILRNLINKALEFSSVPGTVE